MKDNDGSQGVDTDVNVTKLKRSMLCILAFAEGGSRTLSSVQPQSIQGTYLERPVPIAVDDRRRWSRCYLAGVVCIRAAVSSRRQRAVRRFLSPSSKFVSIPRGARSQNASVWVRRRANGSSAARQCWMNERHFGVQRRADSKPEGAGECQPNDAQPLCAHIFCALASSLMCQRRLPCG